jgi:tetratricopeptide (TPR) repeat protein
MAMFENLRAYFLPIAGLVLIILLAAPTPVNQTILTHIQSAQMAGRSGHAAAVFEHLDMISALLPSVEGLHILKAEAALAMGQPEETILILDTQSGIAQSRIEYHCLYAMAAIQLGRQEEAFRHWELTGRDCPQFEAPLRTQTDKLFHEEQYAEAESALTVLNSINPSDPESNYLLGLITAAHDPQKALAFFRLADDLAPEGHPHAQELILAIEDSRSAENPAYSMAVVGQILAKYEYWGLAAEAFRGALAIQPDYIDAKAYYGLCLDKNGEDGLTVLQEAVNMAPDQPLPHLSLGLHWLEVGNLDSALDEFEVAAQLDPSNPLIAIQIGQTYDLSGETATAIEAYRIAAELSPQEPSYWILLAQASLAREYQVGSVALPAARNAVALDPANPSALDALGYAYFLVGDLDYAERFLFKSIRIDPSKALTQYHFGLLRLIQNNASQAYAALRLAQQLDPDGPVGDLAQRALQTVSP